MVAWDPTGDMQAKGAFSDQVKEVVAHLRQLATAETMEEHEEAAEHFSQDVACDTPLAAVRGRDAVRCGTYRCKFLASCDMDPLLAQVLSSDAAALHIRYLANLKVFPKRTWVNPLGFLLPGSITATALVEVTLGSRKKQRAGDITAVKARLVNLPALPAWLRAANGWAWAGSALLTEPLWGRLVHLLGDPSYRRAAKSKAR